MGDALILAHNSRGAVGQVTPCRNGRVSVSVGDFVRTQA